MPRNADRRDREWFEDLWRENHPEVLKYLLRRLPGRETALETASDVMTVAWRKPWKVPKAKQEQRAWLLGVARNLIKNANRSAARKSKLVEKLAIEAAPKSDNEENVLVLRALSQLSVGDQEVLMLKHWDCLRASEISTVTGCSKEAASKRIQRAESRFKEVYMSMTDVQPDITHEREV